jgi:hypothetical protein
MTPEFTGKLKLFILYTIVIGVGIIGTEAVKLAVCPVNLNSSLYPAGDIENDMPKLNFTLFEYVKYLIVVLIT